LPRNHHDLGPIVLNFLFKNLEKCRDINGIGIIDYEKCYKETMDEEVILVEPVGHLVFSISMVLRHMKNAKVSDNIANEIDTLLENLVTRMSEKTTTDLGYVSKIFMFGEPF
jgi:FANCI helical domain 2